MILEKAQQMYARATTAMITAAAGTIAATAAQAASGDATARWTGLYAGVHGQTGNVDSDNTDAPNQSFSGLGAGAQVGYNFGFEGLVVGAEANASFVDYVGQSDSFFAGKNVSLDPIFAQIDRKISAEGSIRAKIGLPVEDGGLFDNILFYGTGGLAWANTKAIYHDSEGVVLSVSQTHQGIVAGGGVEAAIGQRLSVFIEATTTQYDREDYDLPSGLNAIQDEVVTGTIGVNWKFGE